MISALCLSTKGANARYHLHLSLNETGISGLRSANGDQAWSLTAAFAMILQKLFCARLKSHIPQVLSEESSQLMLPLSGGGLPCTPLYPCLLSLLLDRQSQRLPLFNTIVNRNAFVNPSYHRLPAFLSLHINRKPIPPASDI